VTHALLFNRSCVDHQLRTATAWRRKDQGVIGSVVTADPPACAENDGPESQIDPGPGDLGGSWQARLPEGLGCALYDKETAVLELDRDRRAITFAFVAKGKFPFSAKAERANRGILPERLFVVAGAFSSR
jgi:hypothetical protein